MERPTSFRLLLAALALAALAGNGQALQLKRVRTQARTYFRQVI
jgi:hypothetical protein